MVERVDDAALASLAARAAEGPVVMLNLLKFKPGGADAYARYGAAVGPLLEGVDASVDYIGAAETALFGDDWDLVVMVRYPTRGALLSMIGSPAYRAIAHLRAEGLERSALVPTAPISTLKGIL